MMHLWLPFWKTWAEAHWGSGAQKLFFAKFFCLQPTMPLRLCIVGDESRRDVFFFAAPESVLTCPF